jgi:hypothetical protein
MFAHFFLISSVSAHTFLLFIVICYLLFICCLLLVVFVNTRYPHSLSFVLLVIIYLLLDLDSLLHVACY